MRDSNSYKIKAKETNLEKIRETLEITLDSVEDGIIITDIKGYIETINPVARELTGWNLSSAKGKHVSEVFNIFRTQVKDSIKKPFDKVLIEGESIGFSGKVILFSKDKQEYSIVYAAYPILNKYGLINGMVIIFHNKTRFYEIEKSLEKINNRYQLLYESMQEGVCIFEMVYDDNGRAIDYIMKDANPNYEKILGIKKESTIGRLASEFFDTDPPKYLDKFADVVDKKEPTYFETYSKKIGGYFYVSAFSTEKKQFVVIFSDITESIKLEHEKKLLKNQLVESKKLESRGFLALMVLVILQVFTAYMHLF